MEDRKHGKERGKELKNRGGKKKKVSEERRNR